MSGVVGVGPVGGGEPATGLRDVVVIGGGCYGTFYAGQLAKARAKGQLACRSVLVVDRAPTCRFARDGGECAELVVADWGEYLDEFLARPAPDAGAADDAIVPSPLMPHLMAEWLRREAGRGWPDRPVRWAPVRAPVGTPYDRVGHDGSRYVSHADWLCPTHCVEPLLCPATRGPRTWEMADTVTAYTRRLAGPGPAFGPALFVTRHRAFGVGMFDVAEARASRDVLRAAAATDGPAAIVVGTLSACHGAVSIVELAGRAGAWWSEG